MSEQPDTREDCAKAQQTRDNDRDDERWDLEKKKGKWDKSLTIKLILPVAAVLLAGTQGYLGWSEYQLHVQHEERDKTDSDQRKERELGAQFSQFVDLALKYRSDLDSPNPEVRCPIVRYITASPAYVQAIGRLGINASLCSDPTELAAAIDNFKNALAQKLDPFREGAPRDLHVVRRDPASKQLYQATCSVTAQNLRGQIKTDKCSLPADVPQGASIYRIEYSCVDPRCGWSYNPDPAKGYAMQASPLGDGRTITWSRKWDGDPHLETYTMYYQLPDNLVKAP